jgi:hypothetical protein
VGLPIANALAPTRYPNQNAMGSDSYDRHFVIDQPVDESMGMKQWVWQKCSEVAYFQNAPAKDPIRSAKYVDRQQHYPFPRFP